MKLRNRALILTSLAMLLTASCNKDQSENKSTAAASPTATVKANSSQKALASTGRGTAEPITRTVKIVYEINGKQFEAVPVPVEEAKNAGLAAFCGGTERCSGDYECIGNYRWRCILNHEHKVCELFKTTEPC